MITGHTAAAGTPALAGGRDRWVTPPACLTCGWVACSGDSPDQHAGAHYDETDHPIACGLMPGPRSRWCYIHQRLV